MNPVSSNAQFSLSFYLGNNGATSILMTTLWWWIFALRWWLLFQFKNRSATSQICRQHLKVIINTTCLQYPLPTLMWPNNRSSMSLISVINKFCLQHWSPTAISQLVNTWSKIPTIRSPMTSGAQSSSFGCFSHSDSNKLHKWFEFIISMSRWSSRSVFKTFLVSKIGF